MTEIIISSRLYERKKDFQNIRRKIIKYISQLKTKPYKVIYRGHYKNYLNGGYDDDYTMYFRDKKSSYISLR